MIKPTHTCCTTVTAPPPNSPHAHASLSELSVVHHLTHYRCVARFFSCKRATLTCRTRGKVDSHYQANPTTIRSCTVNMHKLQSFWMCVGGQLTAHYCTSDIGAYRVSLLVTALASASCQVIARSYVSIHAIYPVVT